MPILQKPEKDVYTELEVSVALSISQDRLRFLLDQNVFNDGSPRPEKLTFQAQDLIMIGFWDRSTPIKKVVRMPHR